jgi:2-phospho-L-lactate guanylyltransferase
LTLHLRAVIPMKPLERCKLRLSAVLDQAQRDALVLGMLERVAAALAGALQPSFVSILGGDDRVRGLAGRMGLSWVEDAASDLNEALNTFTTVCWQEGWKATLFVAGDLPRLQSSDVLGMIEAGRYADAVIAAGLRGGTNAILIRSESGFRFQMGGRSYARHCAQLTALGLRWQDRTTAALQQDLDTPGDLTRHLSAEPALRQLIGGDSLRTVGKART